LNRHWMFKQNGMAASEKIRWRPRWPLAGAHHGMSLSSQIVNDPRALSAALYVAQLVVLQRVLAPLGAVMLQDYQPAEPALCNKASSSLKGQSDVPSLCTSSVTRLGVTNLAMKMGSTKPAIDKKVTASGELYRMDSSP
jgi:hypothetical protein